MGLYEQTRKNIRKQMIEKDMKQEELARRIGKSPQYLSDMLTGRKKINLAVLISIADVLDVSLDSLCPSEKQQAAG